MNRDITIQAMNREEMDSAIELAAHEGWNPGLNDAGCFYDTDREGFLMGMLGDKAVGCISAVSYEGGFGFVGFYIVVPECRGQGYGLRLWNAAMDRLKGHNVGLDGVVEQQQNYGKSGFRLAYRNIRYRCSAASDYSVDDSHLVPLEEVPRRMLSRYDRLCFPAARTRFLDGWLAMPQSHAIGWLEAGALHGYGVIRKCREGHKIGPLFADDVTKAEAIFRALSVSVRNEGEVYLDVPEANGEALGMAAKYRMEKVFETARMYTGPEPAMELHRIFGVTTFELG
jgi:GNAT superfamily N-acetyltransferase